MQLPGVKARIDKVFNKITETTGANRECPFCGNLEWMRTGHGHVVEVPINVEENPTAKPLFTTALGFTCTRCGFIRLHEVDPASWGRPGDFDG